MPPNPYERFTTNTPSAPAPANPYARFTPDRPAETPAEQTARENPEIPLYMVGRMEPNASGAAPSRNIPAATPEQIATRAPEADLGDYAMWALGPDLVFNAIPGWLGNRAAAARSQQRVQRIMNSLGGANAEGDAPSTLTSPYPFTADTALRDLGRRGAVGLGFFADQNPDHRAAIIRHNYPDAEFRRDTRGNLQFRYNRDGEWTYINRPGVGVDDAWDVGATVLKYYPAARVGVMPATIATRAGAAGAASGATEYASQEAARLVGGPGADTGDVGAATLFGALGQGGVDTLFGVGAPALANAASRSNTLSQAMQTVQDRFGPGAGYLQPIQQRALQRVLARPTTPTSALPEMEVSAAPPPRRVDPQTRGTPEDISDLEAQIAAFEARGPHQFVQRDITDRSNVRNAVTRGEVPRLSEGNQVQYRTSRERYNSELAAMRARLDDLNEPYFTRGTPEEIATLRDDLTTAELRGDPNVIRIARERLAQADAPISYRDTTPPPAPPAPSRSDVRAAFDRNRIEPSRGQVAQNVRARQIEDDLIQRGILPAKEFANRQAEQMLARGMEIATRGRAPIAGTAEDAGLIVQDEIMRQFRQLDDLAEDTYTRAFAALRGQRVMQDSTDSLLAGSRDRLERGVLSRDDPAHALEDTGFRWDDILADRAAFPSSARIARIIEKLADDIEPGNLNFSVLERRRQAINAAINNASGSDLVASMNLRHGFDEWLTNQLTRPQTGRVRSVEDAVQQADSYTARVDALSLQDEARKIWSERERLFSQRSSMSDPGGAMIERIRDPRSDISGADIINTAIGGARSIPTAKALGALRRIKAVSLETTPSGRLAPKGEVTDAMREFNDPQGLLTPAMQALRESFWMRVMKPLRDRSPDTLVPARAVANNLQEALTGNGAAVTRELHTRAELDAMWDYLQVLKYAERPVGVGTSGTALVAERLIGNGVDQIVSGIPLIGGVLRKIGAVGREVAREADAAKRFSLAAFEPRFPNAPVAAPAGQVLLNERGGADRASPDPFPRPQNAGPPVQDPMEGVTGIRSVSAGTITFQEGGRWVTLPTIVNGVQIPVSAAIREWREGRNPPVAEAANEIDALNAARSYRSTPATVP